MMVSVTNVERPPRPVGEATGTWQRSGEPYDVWASQDLRLVSPTESSFLDEAARSTLLARIDDILEILEQAVENAVYFQQLRDWSRDLRNEIEKEPRALPVSPEQLYDELYQELVELERRSL